MITTVIYIAQQVGNAYRGEVLDAKTYSCLLKTAHTYPNETIAKIAARRTWLDQQDAVDHAAMMRDSVKQADKAEGLA